jgi:hypothetical protein
VRWVPVWELIESRQLEQVVVTQLPASKGVKTEDQEATVLEAVFRRLPVRTQHNEKKNSCVL